MDINFLLIFFIARYLSRSMKMQEQNILWNQRLKWIMYVSLFLLVVETIFHRFQPVTGFAASLSLLGFTYMLYSANVFKPARYLVVAIAPYAIISLLTLAVKYISPVTYTDWKNSWEDNLSAFAIIWGVGVWIVTIRQRKELNKANERVAEQEKNNKVMSAMKAQLEIQVRERTAELTNQKEELEAALENLKATQSQLIQSEKMASLGELTAGIAHEIQNPLNFVNNFSEVNTELIEEMKEEINKGNFEDVKHIANDIKDNELKIIFHGKRADAIVKGMLQHSRSSGGQKELTDINALADEYLRLAYHGLRAKDKSFNATMKTDFDPTLEKINIIPQDVGRVILNLITNAFYAVALPHVPKAIGADPNGDSYKYEPTVWVSTKKTDEDVIISVRDNGPGIPQNIVDKIFQPFFTTKPTGQGTGLGLSLSYDIIKAHGGELHVETKEGSGATFIISLPLNTLS